MQPTDDTLELGQKPAYTTSKQVQAWFLRRSRDLWKKKYAELKTQFRRSQQRVSDVNSSRQRWRGQAEETSRRLQALRAENARLQAELDIAHQAREKNDSPARPR